VQTTTSCGNNRNNYKSYYRSEKALLLEDVALGLLVFHVTS
jgi:hypothetical protein